MVLRFGVLLMYVEYTPWHTSVGARGLRIGPLGFRIWPLDNRVPGPFKLL